MFKYEKDNKKIGAYIQKLIEKKYPSHRQFCKAYLVAEGVEPNDEELRKLSNRLSQILKGNKAIQTYDLPYFTDLLCVSCEEILSCGKSFVPVSNHVTNYEIAFSKEPKIWEKYICREDKLILNPDEYNKTVIDYAIEFKNYAFIKYLLNKGYIWFVDDSKYDCSSRCFGFAAGTNIKRREIGSIDTKLDLELKYHCEERGLRQSVIAIAMENKDYDILDTLKAREIPALYQLCQYRVYSPTKCCDYYNEDVIEEVARSNDKTLAYFSDEFQIIQTLSKQEYRSTFIYPFLGDVIEKLIENKSKYAEPVIRKAIEHNEKVLGNLLPMLNEAACYIAENYPKGLEITSDIVKKDTMTFYYFFDNDGFVSFLSPLPKKDGKSPMLCSNVIRTKATSSDLLLDSLIKELNKSFEAVQNIETSISLKREET